MGKVRCRAVAGADFLGQTVYSYYSAWEKDGTAQAIHDLLRAKVREQAGRSPEPSTAILDAQPVKTSCNPPESTQGIDAGKKIKGRKRHIATDTLGLLLAVLVTAASVQDNAGGQTLIGALATAHPAVARAWVDAGYKRTVADEGARHGIDVRVYTKQPGLKGFHATPRWPVERTFGWLMLHRRLARDYELPRYRGNSYYPAVPVIPSSHSSYQVEDFGYRGCAG